MPLAKEAKIDVFKEFGKNEKDTGSTQSQIALLTKRIKDLSDHCKQEPKDHHSRRGLLKLVGQRRRLLRYVKNADESRYKTLIKRLGLRR